MGTAVRFLITGRMSFRSHNQQCQGTEDSSMNTYTNIFARSSIGRLLECKCAQWNRKHTPDSKPR